MSGFVAGLSLEPLTFFLMVLAAGILAGALGSLLGSGWADHHSYADFVCRRGSAVCDGASLVSVIATSSGAAATYVRDRMVNLRLAMFLELATTTGAVVGALLAGVLPVALLSLILGLVLAYASWSTFLSRGTRRRPVARAVPWRRVCGCRARTSTRRWDGRSSTRSRGFRRDLP